MSIQDTLLTQEEQLRAEEMRVLHAKAYEQVRVNPQETYALAYTVRDFAKETGDMQLWGATLITIGIAHCIMNNIKEGEQSFLEAQVLFRQSGDTVGEIRVLHNMGNMFRQLHQYDRAVEYCQAAVELCRQEHNPTLLVSILNNMGMAYKELGTWQKALECYKQAEYVLDGATESDIKNQKRVRQATLNNMGGLLHSIGDTVGAMECYVQALHIAKQWNNPAEETELLHNLTNICRHLHNIPDALTYCQRSLEIAEQTGAVRNLLYPLMNMGGLMIEMDNLDAAAQYLERALTLAREIESKGTEVRVLLDSVPLYQRTGQVERAFAVAEQARGLCREGGDYQGELVAMFLLGEQYLSVQQGQHAVPLLEQGLAMAEQLQSHLYVFRACQGLSVAHKQMGNYEQALAYHERYHAVEKEVFNEESDKKVKALMVQVQMERTEHERELYRNKAELLQQEVEFKRRELASHALHLVERDKLIRTTERFLEKLQSGLSPSDSLELKKVVRMLKNSRQETAGWDVFDEKFQELHGEFTGKLSSQYPMLSPSEVKVCVLTKLHLSTKEIAAVLHTGVRTVEAHRYRLRKKLDLDGEVNLVSWLNSL